MNTSHLSALLLLSLLLTGCSAVPLSRVNQGLEVSYQTAHVIDVLQTWHGQALDKCYEESDPLVKRLIGRNPSTGGVLAWGVGEAAIHYGVYRLLADHGHDRLAAVWEAVTVTATVATVANNYSIGVRVGAKNLDKGCTH